MPVNIVDVIRYEIESLLLKKKKRLYSMLVGKTLSLLYTAV